MGTRRALHDANIQIEDSIGLREENTSPVLSPVPNAKDVGRRGIQDYGKIAIKNLLPDPSQPRVEFDSAEIDQLALSLREQGQLQPIRVRWSSAHQTWFVISGERRYRAAKQAGLETIACYFDETNLTASQILEQQLVENLLRANLQPIEEAKAFSSLMGMNDWDGKSLAKALRISASRVSRSLALLKLPAEVQSLVEEGKVSATAAYEISKLPTAKQRNAVEVNGVEGSRIPTRNAIKQAREKTKKRKRGIKQSFSTEEGWKVVITSDRQGNYHEIAEALRQVLEEVELRIDNNVVLS